MVGWKRGNCVAAKGWSKTIDTLQKERKRASYSIQLENFMDWEYNIMAYLAKIQQWFKNK